jgi:pimeloyl-ACP methyl ester carboxylesterase
MTNGEKSPAYVMAKAGFDVWLGNSRGNKYSRRHKTLDPDTDKDFWQFSWEQMGLYDLPAAIDFVRNMTKVDKVAYFGHS